MATPNRTLNTSVRKTPEIQRTGDPHQLTIGPVPARKPRPTIALLREALNAFNVRGTCRLVAFEVFTYWKPGGSVFLLMKTISEGIGIEPRIARRHLARLERIGIWVRVARKGQSNTYELRLPGGEVKTKCPLLTPDRTIRGGGSYDPPEVTTQVDGSELRASAPATSTVRTQIDGTQARPLTGAGEPLPESSTKRKAAAAAAIASFDATFDPITEAQRWAEAVEAVRPAVSRVIGCPACGSDRLMGGSCDQCGHDIGSQFRASADWNMSGDT